VTDTPSTEALAEAAQRIVAMFDGNPVIEPSSAFAEAIAGLRDTLTAIPAPNGLADRFSKQAKDAAAIHDAFHDGVASAFREAAREVRAALEGATERPLDVPVKPCSFMDPHAPHAERGGRLGPFQCPGLPVASPTTETPA
jgi:hypothetical protein